MSLKKLEQIRKEFEKGKFKLVLQYATELMNNNYIWGQIWRLKCLNLIDYTYDVTPLINDLENALISQQKRNSIEFIELLMIKWRRCNISIITSDSKNLEKTKYVSDAKEIFEKKDFQRELSDYQKFSAKIFLCFETDYYFDSLVKNLNSLLLEIIAKDSIELDFLKFLILRNIAFCYGVLGQVEVAIIHAEKALKIIRKFGNKYRLLQILNGLGVYYSELGDFSKSKQYFEEGLSISIDFTIHAEMTVRIDILNRYGSIIFQFTLNSDLADFYLSKAQNLIDKEKIKLPSNYYDLQTSIYHSYFIISLYKNNTTDTLEYLKLLEQMAQKTNNKFSIVHHNYSKAIYHLSKGRIKDKFEALNLLQEILNEKQVYRDVTYPAIMLFISISLTEYEETEDKTILDEINKYIMGLRDKSNVKIKIQLNIIKSKILLLEGKINDSLILLEESLSTVKEKKILSLESAVISEIEKIDKEKSMWKDSANGHMTSQRKLRVSDVRSYVNDVVKIYGDLKNLQDIR